MHVNRGEVLCLLGDNGAGKSTLIKTLSGVYAPTEGEILMNGRPVKFLTQVSHAQKKLIVFQWLAPTETAVMALQARART